MKIRKTVDADLIMSMAPCSDWPESRVREAVPRRISVIKFLRDEAIPAEDRLWVVLHDNLCSQRVMRIFSCDCADRALSRIDDPDQRSVDAVAVARRHADGLATDEELAAAWDDAWDAARAAARAAAWDAARAAASSAARAAAWDAARAAASSAAWDVAWDVAWDAASYAASYAASAAARTAARDAAMDAEQSWQCEHLAEMMEAVK